MKNSAILFGGTLAFAMILGFANWISKVVGDFLNTEIAAFIVFVVSVSACQFTGALVRKYEFPFKRLSEFCTPAVMAMLATLPVPFIIDGWPLWILGLVVGSVWLLFKLPRFPSIVRLGIYLSVAVLVIVMGIIPILDWSTWLSPFQSFWMNLKINVLTIMDVWFLPMKWWYILSSASIITAPWFFGGLIDKIYNKMDPYGLP